MLEQQAEGQAKTDGQARQSIDIELNPDYVAITHKRLSHATPSLPLKAAA